MMITAMIIFVVEDRILFFTNSLFSTICACFRTKMNVLSGRFRIYLNFNICSASQLAFSLVGCHFVRSREIVVGSKS